jgi:hypothetical protein
MSFENDVVGITGDYPPGWAPAVGEHIVGRILKYETIEGDFQPVPVATVETEVRARCKDRDKNQVAVEVGGDLTVWISPAALRSAFKAQTPRVGERIGLKRLDDGVGRTGRTYKRYGLMVDRAPEDAPVPDFGAAPTYREQADEINRQAPAEAYAPFGGPPVEEAFSNEALDDGGDLPF